MNTPFLAKSQHGDVSHNHSAKGDQSIVKEDDLNFTNILMSPTLNSHQPKTVQLISIDMNLVNKESFRKTKERFHSESAKAKLASMTDPNITKMNGFNLFNSPVVRGQRVLLTSSQMPKSLAQSPSPSFVQPRGKKIRHLTKSSLLVDQSQTQSSRVINHQSILSSPIFLQPYISSNSPERQVPGRSASTREVNFIGNELTLPQITPKVETKDHLNTTNLMWPPIKINPNILNDNRRAGKGPKRLMKIASQERQTFVKKIVDSNKNFGDCIKPIISEKSKALFSTTETFLRTSKIFSFK